MRATDRIPQFYDLLNPTLEALHDLGGSGTIQEIDERIVERLQLPPSVAELPHKGAQTKVQYRSAWARTGLRILGLIENSERGVWALTPRGRETSQIDVQEAVAFIREYRQAQHPGAGGGEPPEEIEATGEPDEWRGRLLAILRDVSPAAFERLCQRLLREAGFIEVEVTGRSGDGGIDGHGTMRLAGLISFNVLFQSKRYASNLGAQVVRDFRGAMVGRADKGLIITTGGFTRDARHEATRDGAPPIDLIDGQLLAEKLKELRLGVLVRMVEEIEVDEEWLRGL